MMAFSESTDLMHKHAWTCRHENVTCCFWELMLHIEAVLDREDIVASDRREQQRPNRAKVPVLAQDASFENAR